MTAPARRERPAELELRDQLRQRREAIGLTQRQVAEHMGVVPSHVSDLERGRIKTPTVATLELWADALGLDVVLRERKASP